jgi:hypothetical protein
MTSLPQIVILNNINYKEKGISVKQNLHPNPSLVLESSWLSCHVLEAAGSRTCGEKGTRPHLRWPPLLGQT